jgi:cation-transporting ATPase 13A1
MQLSLAVNNALLALSKNRIFCTEPHRIPMAGAVDVVCFDKTGTLTSDSFHVAALLAAEDVAKPLPSPLPKPAAAVAAAPEHSRLVLAACHELSVMTKDAETTLLGDPLEAAAFEAVGARFVAPLSGRDAVLVDSRESVVLQRFPFASSKRRMTAVVAVRPAHGPALQVVTKGAPEALYPLLDPAHRPDADAYAATCSALAHKGLRVLALAWRPLKLDKAGRPLPGLEPAAAAAAADLTFEAAVRAGALQTCPQAVAEDGLRFAGLVAFASPLKRDSREVVAELRESGHRVIMITGDHVQTAASVARELDIVDRPLLTLAADEAGVMTWIDDQGKARAALDPAALGLPDDCDFAITGDTLAPLSAAVHAHAASPALAQVALGRLFLRVSVFARAVPKDKEAVIRYLRAAGSTCVMCGDGTNDVGALRTAEIGIALLSRERVAVPEAAELTEDQKREAEDELIARTALNNSSVAFMQRQMATLRAKGDHARVAMLRKQVLFLCEAGQEEVTLRPGDASIAAPFTAKHASARCVRDLLLQGRCALVTTMQMYQILAINCLIAAYHMSALFLKGVKTGEAQMTIQGMVVAGCFFMLSRGAPLDKLHPQRPHARIFSKWMLATVSLQFVIHLATLKAASDMAEPFIDHTTVPGIMAYDEDADTDAHGIPIEREAALPTATATTKPAAKPAAVTGAALDAAVSEGMHTVELDAALLREIEEETTEKPAEPKKGAFVPNVLNTTLYLVQTAMTAATFLANYRGWPFMTPLREHAALYKTLLFTVVGCALAALEVFPDINAQLELVPLPSTDYSLKLCALIVVDVVLATAVGQLLMRLCAQGPKHEPRTKLKVD